MSHSRPRGILAVLATTLLGLAMAVPAQAPFRDGFEPGPGVLLEGDDSTPAMAALIAYGPHAARGADIQDDVLLTRIEAAIAPEVTVMQVNAALAAEQANIVAMQPGLPMLTLQVPRQPDLSALEALAQRLLASSAFVVAHAGRQAEVSSLPPAYPGDTGYPQRVAHLLASRFPAAWNVSRLATEGCESRRVRMVVPDYYHPDAPAATRAVLSEVGEPRIQYLGNADAYEGKNPTTIESRHGYEMLGVLASRFDIFNGTGAMPFPQCLDIDPVSKQGATDADEWLALHAKLRTGEKIIVSRSVGNGSSYCPDHVACESSHFASAQNYLSSVAENALFAATVIVPYRNNIMLMSAAGNNADELENFIYPGFGMSYFKSESSLLSALTSLDTPIDRRMRNLMTSGEFWDPAPDRVDFSSLRLSDERLQHLSHLRQIWNLPSRLDLLPILRVGAGITTPDSQAMTRSVYSNYDTHVSAPVDPIYTVDRMEVRGGTSSATPQVAGLAAYLWLISPELRQLPAIVTRQAIVGNVADVPEVWPIDAYASVLSTDKAVLPTPSDAPVRLALLDLDENGEFDQEDIESFLATFWYVYDDEAPRYGRTDLNGDGVTAGRGGARFDLDRVGSTRFGLTQYSVVTQWIEDQRVSFDERRLSDLQILCYYAYSPLYTGDAGLRSFMLADKCSHIVGPGVEVDFGAYQVVISGDTAYMLESNYPVQAGNEDARLRRMNLRTSQFYPAEKIHAEGTQPDRLLMTNALMPTPEGRSPLLATWFVHGPREPVEGGAMSSRKHVWARYFDPRTQTWDPAIELGSFLDSNIHMPVPAIDMAVDAQGNAMVLWLPPITHDSSYRLPTYRYRDAASGEWSATATVGTPNESLDYEIAAGKGVITLAWRTHLYDGNTQDFRIRVRRFDIATASWGEENVLANELGVKFALAMDPKGGAIVAWGEQGQQWVANYSMSRGEWSAPSSLGPILTPMTFYKPRLSVAPNADAFLHWRESASLDYTYAYFRGGPPPSEGFPSEFWSDPKPIGRFFDPPKMGPEEGFSVADGENSSVNARTLEIRPFYYSGGEQPPATLLSRYEGRELKLYAQTAMGADGTGVIMVQALDREPGDSYQIYVVDRRVMVVPPAVSR